MDLKYIYFNTLKYWAIKQMHRLPVECSYYSNDVEDKENV